MIRKFMAATLAVVVAVGSIFAEEIKGVFVKSTNDSITIKVDDKEKTYKIDTSVKLKRKDKDGNEKEYSIADSLKRRKEGDKVTVITKDDKVVEVKGGKGKN